MTRLLLICAAALAIVSMSCGDNGHRVFETCYDWNKVDPPVLWEYPLTEEFAQHSGCWESGTGGRGPRCLYNCPPPSP